MDITAANPTSSSFTHGCTDCRSCFGDIKPAWHASDRAPFGEEGKHRWLLRANPAYWGSSSPDILVLGFSKGPEQNKLIDRYVAASLPRVSLEDIPFNDEKKVMRPNLKKLLTSIGLLDEKASIDALFRPTEKKFGFASLVRCSVEYAKPNSHIFVGTGSSITQTTLKKRPRFVETCIKTHLTDVPESTKLIIMLGVTTGYVNDVRTILDGDPFFPEAACSYAYSAGRTPVIHIPHPSGGNNGAIAVFTKKRAPTTESWSEDNIPECRRQVDITLASMRKLAGIDNAVL
jgi:hypothetical protein